MHKQQQQKNRRAKLSLSEVARSVHNSMNQKLIWLEFFRLLDTVYQAMDAV